MSEVANALEMAALRLEHRAGNPSYEKAWKVAARVVRELKQELTEQPKQLTDNAQQISSS